MINISNPFAESTLTEHIAAEDFVTIFSPVILEEASALFHQGNVVLAGTPGTGKSMLLALLKPETRIAYLRAKASFPVSQPEQRKFISAGINLTKAGAQDFGHRLAVDGIAGEKPIDLTLFFADFFNYYLVFDLLKNIETYLDDTLNSLQIEKGLNISEKSLDRAAKKIASASCWFKYLEKANSFSDLIELIDYRLTSYRSYFNFNTNELSGDIRASKTAIGEPIATIVSILRSEQLIDNDTSVFIRVDQVEELYHLEAQYGLGSNYRQVINKALAMRDKRVSYRLGMRHYALEAETHVFGTASRLEEERDFFIINLDNVLKRVENQKNWRFPTLANDIFARRLESAGYFPKKESAVRDVFGIPMAREELAVKYAGKATDRLLDLNEDWPEAWKSFLKALASEKPLSAKFGEAWARQRGKSNIIIDIPSRDELPWAQKRWWVKERNEHALMLIASKAGQRLIWSGDIDLYELSGGNVHVFIAVCRHIWQAWLRSESGNTITRQLPKIDFSIQATGVYDASRSWFEKVIPHGFNGSSRQRIVRELGEWMAKRMATDKAMSNPGHNGFSITEEELADDVELSNWLNLATGFGDLVTAPHTTKLRDRKLRRKWYLNPILSPYFRIPHVHTKEPIYTSTAELRKILSVTSLIAEVKAQKKYAVKSSTNGDPEQLNLFS